MKQLEVENPTSETNPSSEDDVPREIEENRLMFTGLVLLLQCFGSLSQDGDNKMCECLFKEGIVSTVICKSHPTFRFTIFVFFTSSGFYLFTFVRITI